jgi:hypothetical protein
MICIMCIVQFSTKTHTIVKNALHAHVCGFMQFYAGFMRTKCTIEILTPKYEKKK